MFVYTLCWILGFPTGYSKLSGGRKYFDWGGGRLSQGMAKMISISLINMYEGCGHFTCQYYMSSHDHLVFWVNKL